jgi:hypothetical protein
MHRYTAQLAGRFGTKDELHCAIIALNIRNLLMDRVPDRSGQICHPLNPRNHRTAGGNRLGYPL